MNHVWKRTYRSAQGFIAFTSLLCLLAIKTIGGIFPPSTAPRAVGLPGQQRYIGPIIYNYDESPGLGVSRIDNAADNGCNMVEISVHWDRIYPSAGSPANWSIVDAEVARARQRGMKIGIRIFVARETSRLSGFWDSSESQKGADNTTLNRGFFTVGSFTSSNYADKAAAFVRDAVNHLQFLQAENRLLFMSVVSSPIQENEFSILNGDGFTEYMMPFDYSESMLNAYRQWLQSRFDLQTLNARWGAGYTSWSQVEPLRVNRSNYWEAFGGQRGIDWQVFRSVVLRRFLETMNNAIRSVNSSISIVNQFGSVWDPLSSLRGTYAFRSMCQNADGIKLNDGPDYNHRFSMDLARSNVRPGGWVAQEVDGMYDNLPIDDFYRYVTESYEHGAQLIILANFNSAYQQPRMNELMARVRAAGLLNQPVPTIQPAQTITYNLSTVFRSGYYESGYMGQWNTAYWNGGQRPVNLVLNEDAMNDAPAAPTPTPTPIVTTPIPVVIAPTPTPTPVVTNPTPAPVTGTTTYQSPQGSVDVASCNRVEGWAADGSRPNQSINVEIYIDGQLAGTVTANGSRPDVGQAIGDNGLHGFGFDVPQQFKAFGSHKVEVRYAGSAQLVGTRQYDGCTNVSTTTTTTTPATTGSIAYNNPRGSVDVASCNRVEGWAADGSRPNQSINVEIYIDGQLAGTVAANGSRPDVGQAIGDNGLHGFGFDVPQKYRAYGSHKVEVRYAGSTQVVGTRQYDGCADIVTTAQVVPVVTTTPTTTTPPPITTPTATATTTYQRPEGHLDAADCNVATGWAVDRALLNKSIEVEFYIDGTYAGKVLANQLRADVGAYVGDNGLHGFSFAIPSQFRGTGQHTIVAKFAGSAQTLNTPSRQYNGCTTTTTTTTGTTPTTTQTPTATPTGTISYGQPEGHLDYANCNTLGGWAVDRSRLNQSISVDIFIDGQLAVTAAANQNRADLATYLGDNGLHGFNVAVPVKFRTAGTHTVEVYYAGSKQRLNTYTRQFSGCGTTARLGDKETTGTWTLYPNPVDDHFSIKVPAEIPASDLTVVVSSLNGTVVLKEKATVEEGVIAVSLTDRQVPTGIYTVSLYRDGQVVKTLKAIKR